jgi:hypothetical protein
VAHGAAGEGARASLVHDSAEFGVLAMTMWRFDPAGERQLQRSLFDEHFSARQVEKARAAPQKNAARAPTIGHAGNAPYSNDFQALRVGVTPSS